MMVTFIGTLSTFSVTFLWTVLERNLSTSFNIYFVEIDSPSFNPLLMNMYSDMLKAQ